MKNKYYCLHAHFDLPDREDPWLEEAATESPGSLHGRPEEQALHLCWGPNSASPLLDADGRILELRNNYESLSFDFGPGLLAWLEAHAPRVYDRIISADRAAVRDTGHGNALAAPYPSLILPLASETERRAALRWGLGDFERRFGRRAEGLRLPENAVDEPTLEALIDADVRFVLLASAQAGAVRPAGSAADSDWREVAPETLSTNRPYRWRSGRPGGGRHIDVFFFRPDLSPERLYERLPVALLSKDPEGAAREQVLDVGRRLANRLVDAFTPGAAVELSHAASDGALYGLARLHGNRALTYALDALSREAPAKATNYGSFLDLIPPPEEVRLRSPSSSVCPHGVALWSAECACRPGGKPARWRAPLREALQTLARELDRGLLERAGAWFRSPAEALDDYGRLAFACAAEATQAFLDRHSFKHMTPAEAFEALCLLEAWRWRLRMLSHWAWSDGDVSEPGPVHALACAARALELFERLDAPRAEALEKAFLPLLSKAPSHGTHFDTAAAVYARLVRPGRVDLERAVAHFAVADHLDHGPLGGGPLPSSVHAYEASAEALCRRTRLIERRLWSLSVCRVQGVRVRTFERFRGGAVVLHPGGAELQCWVATGPRAETGVLESLAAGLDEIFLHKPPDALRAAAERALGPRHFSIDALLAPTRRAAISRLGAHDTSRSAPQDLPGARALRLELSRAAREFAGTPGPGSLLAMKGLLDEARGSGLHLSLWELQDLALQGLKRWAGPGQETQRRELARSLGLSDALFLWPPPAAEDVATSGPYSGDSHGDTQPAPQGQ